MGADGRLLPAVQRLARVERAEQPGLPHAAVTKTRSGKWVIVRARSNYAKICNAVYGGVHATLQPSERVACGVTAPRGNNNPTSARAVRRRRSPFLRAVKTAGPAEVRRVGAPPVLRGPSDQPTTKPVTAKGAPATAVTLGNISDLIREVTQLYGNKRIWITEYGYQTNPPDKLFGVSYAKQARYLKQAFAIARKNPRIDMMLWFLLKDDPNLNGWQSGLITRTRREEAGVRRVHEDGGSGSVAFA